MYPAFAVEIFSWATMMIRACRPHYLNDLEGRLVIRVSGTPFDCSLVALFLSRLDGERRYFYVVVSARRGR
jgi:hypothetical protein